MKYLFFIPLLFLGCAINQTSKDVKNFAKCYIHKIPAPFWVCYQSSFISVGKVKSEKISRIKQEEAYSQGVSDLIAKLQSKTKLLLRKLDIKNEKIIDEIKSFVIINALQGESWYDKKNKMFYVEVKVDKKEFKNLLKNKFKISKKNFEEIFDETF